MGQFHKLGKDTDGAYRPKNKVELSIPTTQTNTSAGEEWGCENQRNYDKEETAEQIRRIPAPMHLKAMATCIDQFPNAESTGGNDHTPSQGFFCSSFHSRAP
jgi:hypothetical protein